MDATGEKNVGRMSDGSSAAAAARAAPNDGTPQTTELTAKVNRRDKVR